LCEHEFKLDEKVELYDPL